MEIRYEKKPNAVATKHLYVVFYWMLARGFSRARMHVLVDLLRIPWPITLVSSHFLFFLFLSFLKLRFDALDGDKSDRNLRCWLMLVLQCDDTNIFLCKTVRVYIYSVVASISVCVLPRMTTISM
ncbi:uncharacterized protein F4822DRAFT_402078 [Hypoxylon trugodes]|uniref:uncharacterized protein n=1 Tax=Hypoxylon trugodes TaxID=326681 RepID=UPI00219B5981|nr:uncharacterized protein F4822DRAFT_402078 [Hypoxylon trugodes]KAI1388190.1 hypothetical protein F4822DRAFT_402078 [Hypoxylon trugodes]